MWIPTRNGLLVGSALAIGAGFLMANAVDAGFTANWSPVLRGLWAACLMLLLLGGILVGAINLGLIDSFDLNSDSLRDGRQLSPYHFAAVYAGFLVGTVSLGLVAEAQWGVNGEGAISVLAGLVFLVAATGHPWWLFRTIKNLGWFSFFSARVMQAILAVLGGTLVLFGIGSL